ncbi:putative quinol monooxygenase [Streptomyces sp. NPDC059866]|uniref:putative quinol monooxygenase n=1 Tax=Streptomyces sp. NPDC059866 TaxID=3346978 RepID=UPI00365B334A
MITPWPLHDARPGEIVVVARWKPSPGERERVLTALSALTRASSKEPGCLGYEALHRGDPPDQEIVLIERYADRAAFEEHLASPHFQRLVLEEIAPKLRIRRVSVCTST